MVALLAETTPDVTCPQEAAGLAGLTDLGALSYRLHAGAERRGGGLITLIHHRLTLPGPVSPAGCPDHGYLLVTPLKLSQDSLLWVGNIHLPPALLLDDQAAVCLDAGRAIPARSSTTGIVCGDFNAPV
jgi:hypothetical protein